MPTRAVYLHVVLLIPHNPVQSSFSCLTVQTATAAHVPLENIPEFHQSPIFTRQLLIVDTQTNSGIQVSNAHL